MKFFSRPFVRRLFLVLWCGAVAVRPAGAYTPKYTVRKIIYLGDLTTTGNGLPILVTGLSPDGLLGGYYSFSFKSHGVTSINVQGFLWDDASGTLLNLANSTYASSLVTCVAAGGTAAGVAWAALDGLDQRQLGFLWQHGTATLFAAPGGADIDTVVAVNAAGQAVGTYFGGDGFKRAFFWDGTQSVDLGDPNDGQTYFVWPASLNAAGQVAGTAYAQNTAAHPPPSTAFQWQAGTLTTLDDVGGFPQSSALGLNAAGEIIGAYSTMPKGSGAAPPGAFDWFGDAAVDLGSPGGGDSVPFFVDDQGRVTGTGYAADNTLHLFGWQAGGGLIDRGPAYCYPDDSAFELTAVNQGGDLAGFSTDAHDGLSVFVRAGGGSQLFKLEGLTNPALDLTPDDTEGRRVFLNDAGLVAVAGFTRGDGTPEVLVLTQDANHNGLPDGWEAQYFPNQTNVAPNADPDGDGLTNLQEFRQGTDPNDFYNGQAPTLTIVSGTPQTGPPGGFAPQALAVQVTDADGLPLTNAPVKFQAAVGQVQAGNSAAPANLLTVLTDGDGQAQVFFRLPTTANAVCTVTATASLAQKAFTITSGDGSGTYGSPFAPTNFVSQANPDGSLDLTWENHTDDQTPVEVELKQADGTWKLVATLPPGTTSYHYPAQLP